MKHYRNKKYQEILVFNNEFKVGKREFIAILFLVFLFFEAKCRKEC